MRAEEVRGILDFVGYFTVLWSGGKDSTAALLWVLDNVKHSSWNILYVEVTGNTHPACTDYVLRIAKRLRVSDRLVVARTKDFFELAGKWGPPLLFAYRWCLYQLKRPAFMKAHKVVVTGARRSDSRVRARILPAMVFKLTKQVTVNPLLDWTTDMVIDYLSERGVELNPCYKAYGHSGNCMFCPYADSKHIALTMSDPAWRSRILSMLEDNRGRMMKGALGRSVYERWMKWARQPPITS